MAETKKCFCGGELLDRGKKFINLSDTRIMGNSLLAFEPVKVYVCKACGRMELFVAEESMPSEEPGFEESLYDRYAKLPTVKLEKILENDSYTEECKAAIRKILRER